MKSLAPSVVAPIITTRDPKGVKFIANSRSGNKHADSDGSKFSRAPFWHFDGGMLEFGADRVAATDGYCAWSSGFLPQ